METQAYINVGGLTNMNNSVENIMLVMEPMNNEKNA